jgi:hypothetical protein
MQIPLRVLPVLLIVVAATTTALADEKVEQRRTALLGQMRTLAEETKVRYAEGAEQPELAKSPVFRYDDQPRQLIDATLWVWTDQNRPAAFLKVEAMDRVAKKWAFCFASASEQALTGEWPRAAKFHAKEPGAKFAKVPDADPVSDRGTERKRQLRGLGRNFSAQIAKDRGDRDKETMRLLATPVMEYADPDSKLPLGAVLGFASNGTNPDMLLILEARKTADGLAWHFAPLRMTDGGITLSYGKKSVWQTTFVGGGLPPFGTWTYFETPRKTDSSP